MKKIFNGKIVKIIVFIFFICIMLGGVTFATENIVNSNLHDQSLHACYNTPEYYIITITQVVLSLIAYILWGIAIYKLIKKDKKKTIILIVIGLILFCISGSLGMFKCA